MIARCSSLVMNRRKNEEDKTPLSRRGGGKRRWDMMMPPFSAGLRGGNWFREFYNMRREMESIFEETLRDMEQVPKELVREYENSEGAKVKEVGPLVYGYSYTIGSDGKPQFREFGNLRPFGSGSGHRML